MSAKSANALVETPRANCDGIKPRMAKAGLDAVTLRDKRQKWARILVRTRQLAGWKQEQLAEEFDVDRAMVGRWENGDENPQMYRYENHPVLSPLLLVAKAEATQGAVIRTLIEVAR